MVFYHKLNFKIISAVISILVVIVGAFFYFLYQYHRTQMIDSLKVSTTNLSKLVQKGLEYPMLENRLDVIREMVDSLSKEEGVKGVLIFDKKGTIKIASRRELEGRVVDLKEPTCQICHQLTPKSRSTTVIFETEDGGKVFRNVNPIANSPTCFRCHDPKEKTNGVLIMDFSMERINRQLAYNIRDMFVFSALMALIMILVVSLILSRMVIRKLKKFLRYTDVIGRGNLDEEVKIEGRDEMAQLANHFNTMTESLKNAQQQVIQTERLAATGKLAASVAHEINNPLQAIENFISLLIEKSEENSDNEMRQYLELSQEGIDRIAQIVKQLQDFYRPEAYTLSFVDINFLLEKVLTFLNNQLSLHNIKVQKELDSRIPEVYASSLHLHQVFTNIILNAQEAMPDGGKLTVRTCMEDTSVRIAFSDTGYGIEETDLEHVFEPFFTTKEIGKGTGLGLSVSYGIIQAHDGNIEVISRTGGGSTFTVVLPVTQSILSQ